MLAAMLRATCSRVACACSAPDAALELGPLDELEHGFASEPAATPAASPRSVIACSATAWKLEPIAAGRVSARSNACATSSAWTWWSTPRPRPGSASGSPVASRRHTSGSRLPAGVMTGQPGPLMCPGCTITRGHAAGDRLALQQRLGRRLAGAVVAVGGARLVLGDRHAGGRPVDPDRPAVDQQRRARAQRVDQVLCGLGGEADHVDHRVGAERGDPLTEGAAALLGLPIDRDPLDRPPLGRGRDTARAPRG